jgi:tetratricopeptide (TPR) repeat protein
MSIDAWPFLVSRNRTFGYRTVVAPQFLHEQGAPNILMELAGGDVCSEEYAYYREIYGLKAAELTLIFCVFRAKEYHIGLESEKSLVDEHGRPIDLIEGIVLRGIVSDILVTIGDLRDINDKIRKAYKEFWGETTKLPVTEASLPISLQMYDNKNQNTNEDLKELVKLIKLKPLHIMPHTKSQWLDKGNTHRTTGHYEEALVAYDQAIRLDPQFTDAYSSKGNALYMLKRYEEALVAYDQAIRLDPQLAHVYSSKGNALYMLKRYERSLVAYDQAIRLDPQFTDAYSSKGNALYMLKRYEEALVAYDQAIRLDPQLAHVYSSKGKSLYMLKRYEEALVAYDQAIRLDPNNPSIHTSKNDVHRKLNRLTKKGYFDFWA